MYEQFKRKIQPLINIYHLIKAVGANLYYGFPSKKLKVIGVTGTDGKTTTTHAIFHILAGAGKKVSMLSSVYAKIGSKIYDTGLHMTTPDATLVQKLINIAARAGDEYFVFETTSHALDQRRNFGVKFQVGVITNVTHEHLDYHKTYERYLLAKSKMLLQSDTSVINADDASYPKLKAILQKAGKNYHTYGLKNKAEFNKNLKEYIPGLTEFNAYNFLGAYGAATLLGIDENTIIDALKNFVLPPGRLELVHDKQFKVIIDFAHTPNSLDKVLAAVKKQYLGQGGRLIHVFGAAGLRDFTKRPIMGEASGKYSDVVIVTEEDYRTEDPEKISKEIALGLAKQGLMYVKQANSINGRKKVYSIILEREKAVNTAISLAKKNDVVILTGKSHEKSLCRGKIEYPWNEKEAVMSALKKKN